MEFVIRFLIRVFDRIDCYWETRNSQRLMGGLLVVFFLITLVLIALKRNAILPDIIGQFVVDKYFAAISYAFTALLIFEVVSLVLSLSLSVSTSIGKQFELLSLVLLRDAFKEISHYHSPFVWDQFKDALNNIMISGIAALIMFVILGFYYRIQLHKPITQIEDDRNSFIASKKIIALVLLFCFAMLLVENLFIYFTTHHAENIFEGFYTLLIFSDILIMLMSLRYGSSYRIAFRNSGFAVATVIIRLALIAPVLYGALMGIGGTLFILAISFAYHNYTPSYYQRLKEKKQCDCKKMFP
ncbi:MAG: hypothetical protein OEY59_12615 [Deltaproteobacteria bacterium]|nr:hypothetical protein [Deltaproteobacteria bacterium]